MHNKIFSREKDLYFVAVKVFLEDGKGNLLITKDIFGDWDLPGGRLREIDFKVPLEKVLTRKMKEELGATLKYTLGEPVVFMRHERNETLLDNKKQKMRIFAVGYKALYKSGKIKLGTQHVEYQWVDVKKFKPEKYFTGGWLKGVREYQLLARSKK
ncbi:MAG: NUDIX domain-containing protein [Candidatus Magasanikbacteria bacterium]